MFRYCIAFLVLAFPAQATTFTSFSLRYDTAPFFSYNVSGPGVPNDSSSQFLGQAASFELFLQLEGFYEELPSGAYVIAPENPDYYYVEVTGPTGFFDIFEFALEFAGGVVTSWLGYAVSSASSDGIFIDSNSVDTLRPFVWDELTSIAAGSWTLQSRTVECLPDDPSNPLVVSCSDGPPNPGVTPVPLPPTLSMIAVGLLLLVSQASVARVRRVIQVTS